MSALNGTRGFPNIMHYQAAADASECDIIVQGMLGPSIEGLWARSAASKHFSAPTVLRIGRAILDCLERLHSAGYVHNDIKPANVLVGTPGLAQSQIYLIDFGSVTRLEAGEQAHVGTAVFASVGAHEKKTPRPIDDIESLVYLLAFLSTGQLPWIQARELAFQLSSTSLTATLKRRAMYDDCTAATVDECRAECDLDGADCETTWLEDMLLAGGAHSDGATEVAAALRGLWEHVLSCEPGMVIDYDACQRALQGTAHAETPFDWELTHEAPRHE